MIVFKLCYKDPKGQCCPKVIHQIVFKGIKKELSTEIRKKLEKRDNLAKSRTHQDH